MKQQFLTALFVLALAAGMTTSVAAAPDEGQQNADVNVTVASETAVDVHPQQLTYTQLTPGTVGDSADEARSFGSVELENVGSTDIESAWVNATKTNSQDPFYGSSNPADFDSANFLQLKPTTTTGDLQGDSGNYTFVNRKEYGAFNDSLKPEYINAPDTGTYYVDQGKTTTASASDVAVGRIRMGEIEYFWAIPTKSDVCNGASTNTFNSMYIAKQPHNATDTVPVDFTADDADGGSNPDGGGEGYDTIPGTDYHLYNITQLSSTNYGVLTVGTDGNTNGVSLKDTSEPGQIRVYDILTRCDTNGDGTGSPTDAPSIVRTRYNVEATGANDLATNGNAPRTQYLINGGTLQPSEAVNLDLRVMVPRGIPQGVVTEGVLRVVVSTNQP